MDTKPFLPRCTHGPTPPCCRRNSSISHLPLKGRHILLGFLLRNTCTELERLAVRLFHYNLVQHLIILLYITRLNGNAGILRQKKLLAAAQAPNPAEQLSRSGRQGQRHTAEQHINGAQKRTEPDQNERNQEQLPE